LVANLFGSDSDSDDSLPDNPTGVNDHPAVVDEKMPALDRDSDSVSGPKKKISISQAVKAMFSSASDSESDSDAEVRFQQRGI